MFAEFDGVNWLPEQEVYRTSNMYVEAMPQQNASGNIYITLLDGIMSTTAYQLTKSGPGWALSPANQPGHLVHWT